jgi:hypothetical protein
MGLSRNLDDLLDRAAQDPGFYSVLAYGSPWGNSDLLHVRSDEDWWREAFAAASLGEPPFTCEYAGSGVIFDERVRRCPPYFNQGFVLAPASMVSALGSVLSQELEAATRAAETFYRFQVALTLAIVRQNLPWRALSIRFNFAPALADVFKVMPEEWEDARDWRQSFFPVNDKQISLSF